MSSPEAFCLDLPWDLQGQQSCIYMRIFFGKQHAFLRMSF